MESADQRERMMDTRSATAPADSKGTVLTINRYEWAFFSTCKPGTVRRLENQFHVNFSATRTTSKGYTRVHVVGLHVPDAVKAFAALQRDFRAETRHFAFHLDSEVNLSAVDQTAAKSTDYLMQRTHMTVYIMGTKQQIEEGIRKLEQFGKGKKQSRAILEPEVNADDDDDDDEYPASGVLHRQESNMSIPGQNYSRAGSVPQGAVSAAAASRGPSEPVTSPIQDNNFWLQPRQWESAADTTQANADSIGRESATQNSGQESDDQVHTDRVSRESATQAQEYADPVSRATEDAHADDEGGNVSADAVHPMAVIPDRKSSSSSSPVEEEEERFRPKTSESCTQTVFEQGTQTDPAEHPAELSARIIIADPLNLQEHSDVYTSDDDDEDLQEKPPLGFITQSDESLHYTVEDDTYARVGRERQTVGDHQEGHHDTRQGFHNATIIDDDRQEGGDDTREEDSDTESAEPPADYYLEPAEPLPFTTARGDTELADRAFRWIYKDVLVYVVEGDVTTLEVDCMVNPAGARLSHEAGVAKAVAEAGGSGLSDECADFVYKNGGLKVAEIYVSGGYDLPCDKVVHVLGPRWEDYHDEVSCREDLYAAYFNALWEAEARQMTSIAIPAVSSGISGVPVRVVTRALYKALITFLKGSSHVSKIVLIDHSRDFLSEIALKLKLATDSGFHQINIR